MSQPTLSHRIKGLEAAMGLFNRSTRGVALAKAGARLYQTLAPWMKEIAALMALGARPAGRVRLTLSDHALNLLWPRLQGFLAAPPEIALECNQDNGFRDIVAEGFDAGIRLGESLAADRVAVRVSADWRLATVAAPDDLARRGLPAQPQDLTQHEGFNLCPSTSGGLCVWEFARGAHSLRVRVAGQLTFNAILPLLRAAEAGLGIAYLPRTRVAKAVAKGRLMPVLDTWCPHFPGYPL
ncbi:LysR substrate-binding domain-containing protein [Rhodobacter sp. KR11]|uniref:LysR substrate-binding domain-containing protein n=1 Tax=Rhodobacter sp. KR11 TaxID=2974588 RepID=UPI002223B195|nr:LysR substrate-binding domain-containing protein [Rhodobacter sp. KR11]MCW1919938.1 LysR substrate-binding domain-containing protein [Rhodobacter sp. KR11]